ncbi:MAG: hypothetical protein ACFFDK_08225 [Promethearchaeota archaeon]
MLLEILQTERQVQYPILRLIIWLAFLVVYIYMAQYIYKDSLRRNLNAELWLLIVLVIPIASWIVYFLVRKEKSRVQEESRI